MSKKILIAEDDRSLASSLGRALEADGYECHYTTDGVATVTEVRSLKPDMLILDLLLPKKDGRKVLHEIRELLEGMPVLSISGVFRGRSTAEELRDLGAGEFLEKPFSVRELLAKVVEMVGPAQEPDSEDGKVRLTNVSPAAFLWKAMSSGFSGAVQFQRDKLHKVIVLEDGQPRLVRSNSARDCLGRRLLTAGKIDRNALDESLRRCRDDGKLQGEVFIELGVVTAEEVEAELAAQAGDKILGVFNWEHGEAWDQSGVNSLSHASTLDDWSARKVILHGVQRMTTAQIGKYLNPLGNVSLTRIDLDLDESESHAPGVAEFFDALEPGALLADQVEQHGRAIYGLSLIGALALGDKADGTPYEHPKQAELQALLTTMQGQDFFQVLDVAPAANAGAIRTAFLNKAKSHHPDKFSSEPEPVRKAAAAVFTLMSNAHDTLTDKDARREYVARLERGSSSGQDNQELLGIMRAESLFRDAEAAVKRRDYAGAAEQLRQALGMNPDEGEFHALMGWCHFLQNHPSQEETAKAVDSLQRAIQLAPSSATGYYYMAKLHKACERGSEAQKMFRKVLEIDPKHQEAMREVRLASMRKDNKGAGLFGLKRKK